MKIVIWIVQVIVTIAFLGAGISKLITPYGEMQADPNMAWVNDFSPLQIQIISLLEVLGALGVILPMIVKKFKFFVPVSAIGLALTMVGAAMTHILRGESIIPNVVLFLLAGLTAWWRRDYLKS